MCGLIGACGTNTLRLDPLTLLDPIRHRGPDGSGIATGQDWIMGHTRLAIQDCSAAAACPYRAGPITLTYNGEVWDHHNIPVGPRETTGDTEAVAKALAANPDPCVALRGLDGMWAMAWHDARTGSIYLARDQYGKIPLYWSEHDGMLWWASEYGGLPAGSHGRAVPPGYILEILPGWGGILAETNWVLPSDPLPPDADTVASLLRLGVAQRLIGDRSIGYLLSGGLDSTLILHLALEAGADVTCYTAVLDPHSPDLAWARRVAADYGVPLQEVHVPPVTPKSIAEAVRVVEVPMKAQVEIALAHLPLMAAVASDGHAVALSGEAADELFGGYGNMQIQAASADDEQYRRIKTRAVAKMARGNFPRVNKVGMAFGVECRLPYMQTDLVALALAASKEASPPGKKLLKAAAARIGIDPRIINRPKETFQGAAGTALAAEQLGFGVKEYNALARGRYGYIPKD